MKQEVPAFVSLKEGRLFHMHMGSVGALILQCCSKQRLKADPAGTSRASVPIP